MASVMDRSAFELAKDGDKYIVESSRDKVIQIRSEKSIHGLTPNVWYVVYFDSMKETGVENYRFAYATELKFSSGNLVSIKRDKELLNSSSEQYTPMDMSSMTVDSTQALSIALKEPVLESLKVSGSDMTLEQGPEGYPVWKVSVWAIKNGTKIDVKVGEIWISSLDGKVCKLTVDPARVGKA